MTITQNIRARIGKLPAGVPFTTSQVLSLGSRAAVDQVLSRLVREGEITRLARGVFVKPKQNPHIGPVLPNTQVVAEAIGRATGNKVGIHGAEAARQLGLTTQVPTRPVFYTTGPTRRFKLGKTEITLKHVAPRKLYLGNRPAGIALSALWYIGKGKVTQSVIENIEKNLSTEEFEELTCARSVMPAWMADAFYYFEQGQPNG